MALKVNPTSGSPTDFPAILPLASANVQNTLICLAALGRLQKHGLTFYCLLSFSVPCHISKFSCSFMCLSLAWKSWQLLHDGKANVSLPPCRPPTRESHRFSKGEEKDCKDKEFILALLEGFFFHMIRTIRAISFVAEGILLYTTLYYYIYIYYYTYYY